MNKKLTFTTIIISALILSACTPPSTKKPPQIQSDNTAPQQTIQVDDNEAVTQVISADASVDEEDLLPQPTVSQSTELDDLEQELNDTQILEEDFSDL